MLAFNRQVNAGIVDPGFIADVRKKLALDQREAAEIFGGGINAFSRYENGKTKPPLALVKLLTVLDRHPELRDMYFGNYTKLVYQAQTDDPALDAKAEDCAHRLGLAYERRFTGYGDLAGFMAQAARG